MPSPAAFPRVRFFDAVGAPLSDGWLYPFAAGTTTPLATFADAVGTANTHPVPLDSAGECVLFLTDGVSYDFALKDANFVTQPSPGLSVAAIDGSLRSDLASTDALGKGAGQIGFLYSLAYGAGTLGKWLKDLAAGAGASFIGYLTGAAGGITRTLLSRLSDRVSVMDFGAKGDGTTDDTAAIQAAINSRKTVLFPKPSAFYKTTAPLAVQYNSHLCGDEGVQTILRNTSGSGSVLDLVGSNEGVVIEHLRIGGANCTGITVAGGGYANYLSTMTLNQAHFEADLLCGINANLIQCSVLDSTFGYYQQTGANASLQHVVSSFSGANNTNSNVFARCKFFNGATGAAAVSFSGGLLLAFDNCRWENNGRDLQTMNVQNLLLLNPYSERGKHAISQFNFQTARTRSKIFGGQFNGSSMPAGASMFRASLDAALLVEDADISTSSAAFAYQLADNTQHSLPLTGVHHIKDCRISGNVSDPLLYLDNIIEDAVYSWTPTPNGIAIVNGTGGVTWVGAYSIRNRLVTATIRAVLTGTATTANGAAGTNFVSLPPNLPAPQIPAAGGVVNDSGASLGVGLAYINGRFFPPAWGAQTGNVTMTVTYPI